MKLSKILPKSLSKELLTFLIFVVLATAAWVFHAMSSVRDSIVYVRVSYVGIPDNVGTDTPLPELLKVSVRDVGSRLAVYKRNAPMLTIDLSDQFGRERGEIRVSAENLRRGLTDLLQGTSHVQDVVPGEIQVPYYRQQEKTVPIILRADFQAASEYQIVGEPELNISRIHIYGSRKALDTITAIETESIHYTDIKDTLSASLALVCPQGIRLEQQMVQVTVPTLRYTEKTITLPVRCTHVPEGEHMRVFPAEVKAVLRVRMSSFGDVSRADVEAVCRYPVHRSEDVLPVKLQYHNPAILDSRVSPSVVEYIIEKNESKSL